uniref:Uncharacterized protein n=1 Tax=Utricularia reniformis TaxID=192314 RepID=A0A1Y0B028_9LAMI|nr:hypothetical protein AEK19_MT0511 [Utricularia reniformis]ART30767.1 hypothetical protein AEK19_MT0511 [Utricularia reniformis]
MRAGVSGWESCPFHYSTWFYFLDWLPIPGKPLNQELDYGA